MITRSIAQKDHQELASGSVRVVKILTVSWAFLLPLTGIHTLGGLTPADLVLFVSSSLCLVTVASGKLLLPHLAGLIVLSGLLFSIVALGSSLFAADSYQSTLNVAKLFVSITCVSIVVLSVMRLDKQYLGVIMGAYVAGCCCLTISAWISSRVIAGRHIGLAGHPVEVGGTVAVAIVYVALYTVSGAWKLTAKVGIIVLLSSAFLRAETVTGPAVVLIALGLTLLLSRRQSLIKHISVIACAVVGGWLFFATSSGTVLFSKLEASFTRGQMSSSSTLDLRGRSIALGFRRIADHPIVGNGMDSAGVRVSSFLAPHNVLVLAWEAGGLVLLGLFIYLLARTLWLVLNIGLAGETAKWLFPSAGAALASWVAASSGPQLQQRTWLLPILAFVIGATLLTDKLRINAPGARCRAGHRTHATVDS